MKNSDGYVTHVTYPAHYHKELNPLWLTTLACLKGVNAPDLTQAFSYCELGCGLGINLLVAASCFPNAQFVGVDVNPQHIAFAQKAANDIGLSNLRFLQMDFAEFNQHNALMFDFMVCHGVWSWISSANQQQVFDAVGRCLKPSGLFYLQYMCHPGSSPLQPIQKLIWHASRGLSANPEQGLSAGLDLLSRLEQAGVFHDQPNILTYLTQLQQLDRAYLVHELLTPHWQPQHSCDVLEQAHAAGLNYLDSANAFDFLERLSIPQAAQRLVANTPDLLPREQLKDLCRNQLRRQDIFQKHPVVLPPEQTLAQVARLTWQLLPHAPTSGGLLFQTPIGPIEGPEGLLGPLLERLAQGSASTAQLSVLEPFRQNLPDLLQSLLLLMWQGYAHPQQAGNAVSPTRISALSAWLEQQDLSISLVASCATAYMHNPIH